MPECIIFDIILGIIFGIFIGLYKGENVYWKSHAKYYKTLIEHADCLYAQIFNHELSRRPPLETVVADSAKQGEKQ